MLVFTHLSVCIFEDYNNSIFHKISVMFHASVTIVVVYVLAFTHLSVCIFDYSLQ